MYFVAPWVIVLYIILLVVSLLVIAFQARRIDRLTIRIRWQSKYIDNILFNPSMSYKPADLPAFYDFNNEEKNQ